MDWLCPPPPLCLGFVLALLVPLPELHCNQITGPVSSGHTSHF